MSTGNLGIKRKDLKGPSVGILFGGPDSDKELDNEVQYPDFTLSNKHIEAAGFEGAMPDDIIIFTVKARVTSVKKKSKTAKDSYDGDRVEMEVQNISNVETTEQAPEEDADEDKEASKDLGFSPNKVSKGGGNLSPKKAGIKI